MNKKNTYYLHFISIILFIISILIFSFPVDAVGVRPLIIEQDMAPGESRNFEIILTPSAKDEVVNLNFYRPIQLETGALSYKKVDAETYPVLNWIELGEDRVELAAGESRKVEGTVTVPFGADLSETVIIMVEPEMEDAVQGVNFKVRYAVRLNINIQSSGKRPRGEVASFDFRTDTGEYPVINSIFHNTSRMNYETSAEASLRNEQGKLVERIELKTPVGWQSGRNTTTIYPGAKVLYKGTISEPLYPGKYQVRLSYHYADGMQLIEHREIFVESNIDLKQELEEISLSPDSIRLNLRPGSISSRVIEVENNSEEEIDLTIRGRDIVRGYPFSIFKVLGVQLRGQQEIMVLPGAKKRIVLTFKAPKDIVPGGYYGFIDFIQQITEDKRKIYSTTVEVVSGEDKLLDKAEIVSLYYDYEEGLLSVGIVNRGAVHLIPEGKLIIKDSSTGKIVDIAGLELQGGVDRILPKQSGLMTAPGLDLNSGQYLAEVIITGDEEIITSKEIDFKVK